VPMSHNAGAFWPRRGFVKKPGTIRLIIGEPITSVGKNARDLTEEIRQAIESGLAKIAGG
jgi:1-acyl-sn-glycerol-3-phosphate acyltransferase